MYHLHLPLQYEYDLPDEETVLVWASEKRYFLTLSELLDSVFTWAELAPVSLLCVSHSVCPGIEEKYLWTTSENIFYLNQRCWENQEIHNFRPWVSSTWPGNEEKYYLMFFFQIFPEPTSLYSESGLLDTFNLLHELRALCCMKRVSSWSLKSFLHSPQVRVSPPTRDASENSFDQIFLSPT